MDTAQFKKHLTKKNLGIFSVAIAAIVFLFLIYGRPKAPQELAQKPKECISLKSTGKQTYDIMTDKHKDFEIVQVDVDPIDVGEGATQIITVKVKDKNNNTITKESGVTANIQTDNKSTAAASFVLRLAEDSKDGSSLLTTWEGSWIRDDSNCHTYMETITATNDKGGKAKVDLSFK